mmetsp:Transcript_103584/g.317140  ORF Transcript_103584/g.317140 Transcript_103584/m.317140 type:complete len:297 (+) Transcript_103584:1130-2020(+)
MARLPRRGGGHHDEHDHAHQDDDVVNHHDDVNDRHGDVDVHGDHDDDGHVHGDHNDDDPHDHAADGHEADALLLEPRAAPELRGEAGRDAAVEAGEHLRVQRLRGAELRDLRDRGHRQQEHHDVVQPGAGGNDGEVRRQWPEDELLLEHQDLLGGVGLALRGGRHVALRLRREGRPRRRVLPRPAQEARQAARRPEGVLRELRHLGERPEDVRCPRGLLRARARPVRPAEQGLQADGVEGLGRGLLYAALHGLPGHRAGLRLQPGGRRPLRGRPVHRLDEGRVPRLQGSRRLVSLL